MLISTDQIHSLTPDTSNTLLLERVTALEARLAVLEGIITRPPGGGVAIVSQGSLRIQVGSNCVISVGTNMAISVGKDQTITVGGAHVIDAGESITLTTGSAKFSMKRSGDVDLTGVKVTVKASGDMVLKGSRILQN